MTKLQAFQFAHVAALAAQRTKEAPHAVVQRVERLYGFARRIASVNLAACNHKISVSREATREVAIIAAREEAERLFGRGVHLDPDGDPRGYSVKLVGLPISNELGGDWGLA